MWLTCVKHKCMYILYEWMHSHSSISGPLAYSKHLAFAIREPNKNTLSYQSVSIIMVSQFFCAWCQSSWHGIFLQRDFRQEEGKWLGKSGWQDRGGWIDGIHGVSSLAIPCHVCKKRMMFKVKKATPKNTWRVLWEVFYMWRFFFTKKRHVEWRVPQKLYQWYLGKWLWWSWKAMSFLTCHIEPNPSGPEEIWERNSTLRLGRLEKVGSWGPWCDQ